MTAIASTLLALYESIRSSRLTEYRRTRPGTVQRDINVDHEFTSGDQTFLVRAVVTLDIADDSDYSREGGYGGHDHVEVAETNIVEVSDADGNVLFDQATNNLSDEQYLDLEAQVAEYARANRD